MEYETITEEQIKELEQEAREVARSHNLMLKHSFVAWVCEAISYHSLQGNKSALVVCERQYKAYLTEINKKGA